MSTWCRPCCAVPGSCPGRHPVGANRCGSRPARSGRAAWRSPRTAPGWNIYQLSEREGLPWYPQVDYHVRRRGAELLGSTEQLCVDLDQHLAVDGSVWLDGLRWLTDKGMAAGHLLDIAAFIAVRTPGNPDRGHGPGWHLWCRADLDYPVRTGPLARCAAVEIKARCTAPGSPGYEVRHAPGELPVIPRWVAELRIALRKPGRMVMTTMLPTQRGRSRRERPGPGMAHVLGQPCGRLPRGMEGW